MGGTGGLIEQQELQAGAIGQQESQAGALLQEVRTSLMKSIAGGLLGRQCTKPSPVAPTVSICAEPVAPTVMIPPGMLTVIGLKAVPTVPPTASIRIVLLAVNTQGSKTLFVMPPGPETMLIESPVSGPVKVIGSPVTETSINDTGASPIDTRPIPALTKRCLAVAPAPMILGMETGELTVVTIRPLVGRVRLTDPPTKLIPPTRE